MKTLPRRRRFLQFSLKTLLLLTFAVAVSCAWFKAKLDRKERERTAIAEIRKNGGTAGHVWRQWPPGPWSIDMKIPPGPKWLRKRLGDDFFSDVVAVSVSGDQITAEWLTHLEPLTEMTVAHFTWTRITNDGVRYMTRFKKITELRLDRTVTDDGLACLKEFPELKHLNLSGCSGVSDAALVHLKEITTLEALWLDETSVTDAGLVHLEGLSNLRDLNLRDTAVTDAGLHHLKGLAALERLWLVGTPTSDAGLPCLTSLSNLKEFWSGDGVTDAGLVHLEGLSNLRKLGISGPGVTDAGIAKLRAALPNCEIF